MLPRERVIQVIRHGKPDRIPIYGWVSANLGDPIRARYGSVEAFEDRCEFDFAHLFGGPASYDGNLLEQVRKDKGEITPEIALGLPMTDPNDAAAYKGVIDGIRHHKEARGRFVYLQTPGIFECCNGLFGIENHLAYLLLYEEQLHEVYRRQAEWNRAFAMNGLDLGVDMIHVSDDWGAQRGLLFSPETWWRMIYPYHKPTCEAVRRRGAFLSLHSDGNVLEVLDGIVKLGYQVVHPWQESAGMSFDAYAGPYAEAFVLMGGLDIQTTLGFGQFDSLKAEIERVMRRFAGGGLLFCTSHFVQAHCTIEELEFAFDTARRLAREVVRGA